MLACVETHTVSASLQFICEREEASAPTGYAAKNGVRVLDAYLLLCEVGVHSHVGEDAEVPFSQQSALGATLQPVLRRRCSNESL